MKSIAVLLFLTMKEFIFSQDFGLLGRESRRGQFPYQVGINITTSRGYIWCGGALISSRWTLTAAHCLDNMINGVHVRAGIWNKEDAKEYKEKHFFVSKKRIRVHKEYTRGQFINDIALLNHPHPVEFSLYITRIPLPRIQGKLSDYNDYSGEHGIATGYRSNNVNKKRSNILRWYKAPILNVEACKRSWNELVSDSNICIDTPSALNCYGDGGDPLVAKDGQVLVGVLSFGVDECKFGSPRVYTRVTSHLDWIYKQTGING